MKNVIVLIILILWYSAHGYSIDPLIQATRYNIIPPSPGLADLGRYGNIGVNNSTGVPEITIPIYTLVLDEVSLPISLSYNASGVRVTDIASEVGLKWNLNTGGVISRTIRGLPDERAETGWFNVPAEYQVLSSWRSDINCYQEQLRILSENLYDPLPDMFDYVLGEFSGSFQFSRSKTLYKDIKNDLKIEPYFDANGMTSSQKTGPI